VEDFDKDSKSYLNSHRHSYHKTFMRTQATAAKFANMFNSAAEALIPQNDRHLVPVIEFLRPMIFEMVDEGEGAIYNVLVEPLIQGKYCKFSDNKGNLERELKRDFYYENRDIAVTSAALLLGREVDILPKNQHLSDGTSKGQLGMAIIEEGSENEESDEVDDEGEEENSLTDGFDASTMRPVDYLASFSHYTYVRSGGSMMVVDLQGSFQERWLFEDGRPKFLLTDPALHTNCISANNFGRTNLGRRGMKAFFKTHQCNACCRLFNFKDKSKHE
jgi:Alpha-kinase family